MLQCVTYLLTFVFSTAWWSRCFAAVNEKFNITQVVFIEQSSPPKACYSFTAFQMLLKLFCYIRLNYSSWLVACVYYKRWRVIVALKLLDSMETRNTLYLPTWWWRPLAWNTRTRLVVAPGVKKTSEINVQLSDIINTALVNLELRGTWQLQGLTNYYFTHFGPVDQTDSLNQWIQDPQIYT